jgi:hypothetical protein
LYFIARQTKYLRSLNEYTENTHLIIKAYKKYSYRDQVPLRGVFSRSYFWRERILGGKLADLGEMLHANFHLYSQLWNSGVGGGGANITIFLKVISTRFSIRKKEKKLSNM